MNLKIEDLDTKGVDNFITQSKNIALDSNVTDRKYVGLKFGIF